LRTLSFLCVVVIGLLLGACGSTPGRAPVVERGPSQPAAKTPVPAAQPSPKESDSRPASYTVQKGDTLYSVALEHGHDYRELAEWNGIQPPYLIKIGQVLRLAPPGAEGAVPLKAPGVAEPKPLPVAGASGQLKTEPKAIREAYSDQALARLERGTATVEAASAAPRTPPEKPVTEKPAAEKPSDSKAVDDGSDDPDRLDWTWPANGKILANFNDNGNSKGLDIGGTMGQPVVAAAAGKVVHTGTTLRGYGKLVIIKHNKSYFSVYAHNSQILVKEGQSVLKGQKIAEMGDTDSDRVKLHFEIRRFGKPTDPLKYLPNDRTS
jgi:lipoprotein NlpD